MVCVTWQRPSASASTAHESAQVPLGVLHHHETWVLSQQESTWGAPGSAAEVVMGSVKGKVRRSTENSKECGRSVSLEQVVQAQGQAHWQKELQELWNQKAADWEYLLGGMLLSLQYRTFLLTYI